MVPAIGFEGFNSLKVELRGKQASLLILTMIVLGNIGQPLYDQAAGASISGRVRDQSNAAVPDTTIQRANVDTRVMASAKTGTSGLYVFPSLQPRTYEVKVIKTGVRDTLIPICTRSARKHLA